MYSPRIIPGEHPLPQSSSPKASRDHRACFPTASLGRPNMQHSIEFIILSSFLFKSLGGLPEVLAFN